jgi:hypothetical protein
MPKENTERPAMTVPFNVGRSEKIEYQIQARALQTDDFLPGNWHAIYADEWFNQKETETTLQWLRDRNKGRKRGDTELEYRAVGCKTTVWVTDL